MCEAVDRYRERGAEGYDGTTVRGYDGMTVRGYDGLDDGTERDERTKRRRD